MPAVCNDWAPGQLLGQKARTHDKDPITLDKAPSMSAWHQHTSVLKIQKKSRATQEYPTLEKPPKWDGPQPEGIDWEALIAEVVERGKEVPEIDWATPGQEEGWEARYISF